jgi:hypothetical protein
MLTPGVASEGRVVIKLTALGNTKSIFVSGTCLYAVMHVEAAHLNDLTAHHETDNDTCIFCAHHDFLTR